MRDRRALFAISFTTLCGCAAQHTTPTAASPRADAQTTGAYVVPSRYDEGRWVVRPVIADGDTLDLYTDSGGGMVFIVRERLNADAVLTPDGVSPQGDSMFTAPWPTFRGSPGFPVPLGTAPPRVLSARQAFFDRVAAIFPARDGALGHAFFAHRVWVFDYPAHRLSLLPASRVPDAVGGTTIPFTFKAGAGAADAPWFPRIRASVDGDSLDLLFDTGATTLLTDSALSVVADGRPASRAASFITRAQFDAWRTRHPDWRVVLHAERGTGADMIEVPSMSIAGLQSGPVWFTARANANFTTYMSQWMDKPIVGALGGSGLRYFRIVADYPNQRATFSRPGA